MLERQRADLLGQADGMAAHHRAEHGAEPADQGVGATAASPVRGILRVAGSGGAIGTADDGRRNEHRFEPKIVCGQEHHLPPVVMNAANNRHTVVAQRGAFVALRPGCYSAPQVPRRGPSAAGRHPRSEINAPRSIEPIIDPVLRILSSRSKMEWTALEAFLPETQDREFRRSALASSFVATLELARLGKVQIEQVGSFSTLYVRAA